MRLLAYVRLSVLDDASTSPERQLEKIHHYAQFGDHELVPITEADYDLDVSGSVSPFERPGLAPWLQDDRLSSWDAICVAKLDRLTRGLIDFVSLTAWLEANGKTLVCLDPQLDLTTPSGRAFAQVLVAFAEYERETIAARVRDAWHKLRTGGQYPGGQVPFGYRPVKLGKGWGYEPDPVYGPVVAEMYDRYVRYESLGSIARWLNESAVPTPWNATRQRNGKPTKNSAWTSTSVRKILGSRTTLGATVTTDGTPVRDAEGVVVYRADALVTRDVWERVQARLQGNPVSAKVNTWTLTGIAFCAACGAPMYSSGAVYRAKRYDYYGCVHSLRRDGQCVARRVKADELEAAISRELLALAGNVELTESKPVPGHDYSEEMKRVAEQIARLSGEIALGAVSGRDVRADQEVLQRAHAELARLAALKPAAASSEPVMTGQTFRQKWAALDVPGRNEFLRAARVRAMVSRDTMPPIEDQAGPVTTLDIPRIALLTDPGLHAVVYLGSLGDMLAATAPVTP